MHAHSAKSAVASILESDLQFKHTSRAIQACGTSTGPKGLLLYCGQTFCPVCHGLTKYHSRPYREIVQALINYSEHLSFLRLTLTLPHDSPGRIRENVRRYTKGRQRLCRRKQLGGNVAGFHTIELKQDHSGLANLHGHSFLAMDGMTSKQLFSLRRDLPGMWAESAGLDYEPQVKLQCSKDALGLFDYCTKGHLDLQSMIGEPEFLLTAARQLQGAARLSEATGLFTPNRSRKQPIDR